jgi:hypothetical protein
MRPLSQTSTYRSSYCIQTHSTRRFGKRKIVDRKERYLVKMSEIRDLGKYQNFCGITVFSIIGKIYYGITLFSIIGKIFNRIVKERMTNTTDTYLRVLPMSKDRHI